MDSSTIDLNRAEQAVFSLGSGVRQGYQPRTLQQHNSARCIHLSIFPTESFGPKNCLLLANVPGSYFYYVLVTSLSFPHLVTHLAPHELARRQHGAYTSEALMMMNNYDYSDNDGFSLSEQDTEELAARLQVGKSIITFNAEQLRRTCDCILAFHESFRRNVLLKKDVALKESSLNSKQMAIALEFYLQIDGKPLYIYAHHSSLILVLTSFFFSRHILHENLLVSWSGAVIQH